MNLISFFSLISPAFAQVESINVTKPEGAVAEFSPLISGGLKIILVIAALAALIYLIWGGIQWITSGGEKSSVAAAKARLSAALIGLIIVLASWAVIKLLEYLFGFSILNFEFPRLY